MAENEKIRPILSHFFFFNDTATTEIYTLSLHDALPIYLWRNPSTEHVHRRDHLGESKESLRATVDSFRAARERVRSEEHTSELQSPCNLVCRLLLEKKTLHSSRTY